MTRADGARSLAAVLGTLCWPPQVARTLRTRAVAYKQYTRRLLTTAVSLQCIATSAQAQSSPLGTICEGVSYSEGIGASCTTEEISIIKDGDEYRIDYGTNDQQHQSTSTTIRLQPEGKTVPIQDMMNYSSLVAVGLALKNRQDLTRPVSIPRANASEVDNYCPHGVREGSIYRYYTFEGRVFGSHKWASVMVCLRGERAKFAISIGGPGPALGNTFIYAGQD